MSTILGDYGFLPLSSLRLIVPPLQLVSAALWEIVKQGAVVYYGLLEEFITTVLETVPELLTDTERVQLVMGLRAKVVLELCCNDDFASQQTLKPHLSRINTYIENHDKETSSSEVTASVTNFLKLVNTLVDDQYQRDIFYQTSLWLSQSPSILKECADFMNQPEPLKTLIQHHKHHGHKVLQVPSSSADDCILSSLSYHLPNVEDDKGDTLVKSGSTCVSQDWQRDNSLDSESKEVKVDHFKEMKTELMWNVEINGQQHADDLTEDQGASIEVILQPFDESESNDEDNMDKKWLRHLKTGSRTSSKSFKCLVCGKEFGSINKLKKHKNTHRGSFKNKMIQSKPIPADKIKKSLPSETDTGPSSVVPQESSDPAQEQMCKRSSRVKQCSVCREVFTCSTDLMSHMRCHIEQSPYLCSYCGKDFDNYKDYETHQEDQCRVSKQHSQDNPPSNAKKSKRENPVVSSGTSAVQPCKSPLTCQKCEQVFTYYKNFEKHQSKCSERAPKRKKQKYPKYLIIKGCNFQSADNTNVSCDETSSETAKTPVSADDADASQVISRTFKCTMCEKNFSKIPLMSKHYSMSHKVTDSYPCSLCKTTFVRLYELVRHQQNKKLYQCAVCKKCFSKSGRKDHDKIHTASVTPRVCETCGQSFRFLAHLVLHQRKHREEQPNVCSHCGKQFSSKDCLRAHMVKHTDGFPCPVCGKKFYRKLYLKWHLYKHTGQEPYLCDTCGKGWPTAHLLKLHMSQHTEERPFKCEDCGVCYKRESHLIAHRRAVHIRLRPFLCEVCSKAFRLNSELKQHMIVHTGERPFSCPRCGKKFKKKCHLRQHGKKACR
ncbi:uncharacterized protein [Pagrus major]|uniref:uncharacterized protein isoform X2 n=1 Tax=Pagrus major TaxID=143350 RepID=UPI003CC88CB3